MANADLGEHSESLKSIYKKLCDEATATSSSALESIICTLQGDHEKALALLMVISIDIHPATLTFSQGDHYSIDPSRIILLRNMYQTMRLSHALSATVSSDMAIRLEAEIVNSIASYSRYGAVGLTLTLVCQYGQEYSAKFSDTSHHSTKSFNQLRLSHVTRLLQVSYFFPPTSL